MSRSGVKVTGLNELREALRNLPDRLKDEAAVIVRQHADEMARVTQDAYPTGPKGSPNSNSGNPPGGLKRGVRVTHEGSHLTVVSQVRSHANHAHLFEEGSKVRRNRRGQNRGQMKPGGGNESALMIPKAIRLRRRMTAALISMVERNGLKVTSS